MVVFVLNRQDAKNAKVGKRVSNQLFINRIANITQVKISD
tara:strand:- start:596 stop:715 length:120 start_codon:yes stop_codon:yes gene_type:complete